MKIVRHICVITAALLLTAVFPLWHSGFFSRIAGGADAVSSPTVVIDQPSGAYVVAINPALHTDSEKTETWKKFFHGDEIDYIFEDLSCVTAATDPAGFEMAKSFQSRLPENQMKLRTEDTTLMLSKASYGRYDVIVMSREFYDATGARSYLSERENLILEEDGL